MGKVAAPRRVGDKEALAVGNTIRGSARKLNLVAQLIRGRRVEEALNILKFSPKGMSEDVYKVLASAVANAENNHNLDVDALVVAEASGGKPAPGKARDAPHAARARRAGRYRRQCRQGDLDEALRAPRPRPFEPHRQAVQPDPRR